MILTGNEIILYAPENTPDTIEFIIDICDIIKKYIFLGKFYL